MAVTAADVKAFAPELAGLSDGQVNTWLGFAPGAVSSTVFGSSYDQGVLLWTCHQCVKVSGGASGAAGPVTMRTVGDVSVQNAAPLSSADYAGLKTTGYGLALMQLFRRFTAGGGWVQ